MYVCTHVIYDQRLATHFEVDVDLLCQVRIVEIIKVNCVCEAPAWNIETSVRFEVGRGSFDLFSTVVRDHRRIGTVRFLQDKLRTLVIVLRFFLGLVRVFGIGSLTAWGFSQVDPAMLQYQNHKLAQQLEHQRSEISALENKCCQFRSKQTSYDDTLIIVNRAWDLVCVTLHFILFCHRQVTYA